MHSATSANFHVIFAEKLARYKLRSYLSEDLKNGNGRLPRARALRTHLSQNKIFQTLRAIKYPLKAWIHGFITFLVEKKL